MVKETQKHCVIIYFSVSVAYIKKSAPLRGGFHYLVFLIIPCNSFCHVELVETWTKSTPD